MTDTDTDKVVVDEGLSSLTDDVFDDSPPEPVQAEEEDEKGDEPAPAEAKAEAEEPEEAKQEVEPPSTEDAEAGLKAAIVAERRRRQEAERELKELRAKEAPDPHEDPEGFEAHVKQTAWQERVENARELMMDVHPDYEEMEAVFMQMVRDDKGNVVDTGLVAKMQSSKNPAKFAYEKAKEYREIEKYRDPAKRAALISEEVEKALEAKLREIQAKKPEGVTATELPSLTGATAAGSNTLSRVKGAETVDELFDD